MNNTTTPLTEEEKQVAVDRHQSETYPLTRETILTLYQFYRFDSKSLSELADIVGTSKANLHNRFVEMKLPLRSLVEANKTERDRKIDKYEQFTEIADIALKLGATEKQVRDAIQITPNIMQGLADRHPGKLIYQRHPAELLLITTLGSLRDTGMSYRAIAALADRSYPMWASRAVSKLARIMKVHFPTEMGVNMPLARLAYNQADDKEEILDVLVQLMNGYVTPDMLRQNIVEQVNELELDDDVRERIKSVIGAVELGDVEYSAEHFKSSGRFETVELLRHTISDQLVERTSATVRQALSKEMLFGLMGKIKDELPDEQKEMLADLGDDFNEVFERALMSRLTKLATDVIDDVDDAVSVSLPQHPVEYSAEMLHKRITHAPKKK